MTPAEEKEIDYLTTLLVRKYSKKFSFVPGYTHKRKQVFDKLFGLIQLKYNGFRKELGLYHNLLNQHTILDSKDLILLMMIQSMHTDLTILKNTMKGVSLDSLSKPYSGLSSRINFICELINQLDINIQKLRNKVK